ncbi:MAG: RNA polymerase sigma factor [Planctomycetota bacterium]
MPDQDTADMLRVKAGEIDRFTGLVARNQSAMFRYAQSRLSSRGLAEDVVQETFLAVFEARHAFDPAKSFRGWLWTILVNRCKGAWKKRQNIAATPLGEKESTLEAKTNQQLEQAEEREHLAKQLYRLPVEQADAIRMRFFGNLSFAEIGEAMECTPSTAKSRVRYGLEKLATALRVEQESQT